MNTKGCFIPLLCWSLLCASIFGASASADESITVRVGAYENSPKIFTDETGRVSGFWPEIIEYIAAEEGWQVEYVPGTWMECLERLGAGEIDIMPDVAYTEERAELYAFSNEPSYVSWSRVYTKEGAGIQSILDLEGKRIAVLEGSINVEGPEGIKKLVSAFDINCTFAEVDSYTRVFELVESGEADAGVTSKDFGNQHEADFNVVKTSIIFQPASLYFAFPKGADLAPYFIERIDARMKELKADENSVYYQALERWLGAKPVEKPVVPGWVKWVLIGIGGAVLALIGGNYLLRSRVRARTKELTEEISERKLTEKALAESEYKYRLLVNNVPNGVSIVQDGKIKFANRQLEGITGYSLEELQAMNPFDIVHPKDRVVLQDYNMRRMRGEPVPDVYSLRIVHKNGSTRWLGRRTTPVTWDGKPAVLMMDGDITERRQTEMALFESEERCKAIFEAATDGILLVDTDGERFYDGNEAICRMIGYSIEELKNLGVTDIHPKKDIPHVIKGFKKQAEGNYSLVIDIPIKRKDGSIFYADINSAPVSFRGKTYLMGMFRDATERRKLEGAVKSSEERLQLMFQSVSEGIVCSDLEGKISDINKVALRMFNYDRSDEVIDRSLFEFIAETDHDKVRKNMRKMLITGISRRIEYTFLRKDGSEFPGELSASVIKDAEGKPVGLVAIVSDITERKQMEEQLILTDRLASIGEVASGIAHELNNPLTAVIGFSEMLLDRAVPDDIREDLDTIYSEAKRAANVVRNLLTFARKHPLGKQPVNINGVIQKVLDIREYEQRVNNIQVDTRFSDDLPEITADGFQLQQVFLNMVINAEYFMTEAHRGGTLTITTEKASDVVRASLADDGPGISKEKLGHIFDPFFTTKEVGKGTGLGLSICHGIITEHGGRIYAKSEAGKGAIFIVELPIADAASSGAIDEQAW